MSPVVGIAATPSGDGYWLAHDDGSVDSYGLARSCGGIEAAHLKSPVTGITAAPSGSGYYLCCADGSVFAFGGVAFYGATA